MTISGWVLRRSCSVEYNSGKVSPQSENISHFLHKWFFCFVFTTMLGKMGDTHFRQSLWANVSNLPPDLCMLLIWQAAHLIADVFLFILLAYVRWKKRTDQPTMKSYTINCVWKGNDTSGWGCWHSWHSDSSWLPVVRRDGRKTTRQGDSWMDGDGWRRTHDRGRVSCHGNNRGKRINNSSSNMFVLIPWWCLQINI